MKNTNKAKGNIKARIKLLVGLAILIVLTLGVFRAALCYEDYSTMRVKLTKVTGKSVSINIDGNFRLRETAKIMPRGEYTVALTDGRLSLKAADGKTVVKGEEELYFIQCAPSAGKNNYIGTAGRNYLGDMLYMINAAGNGIEAINYVYMEDYVAGVVPYEIGDYVEMEAIKAQAVAARSYAASYLKPRSYYDVVDTSKDQVYGGYNASLKRTLEAVAATKNLMVTCDGELVCTFFASSNGGMTDISQHVWPSTRKREPWEVIRIDTADMAHPASSKEVLAIPKKNVSAGGKLPAKFESYLKTLAYNALKGKYTLSSYKDIKILTISSIKGAKLRSAQHAVELKECTNHPKEKFAPVEGEQACTNYSTFNVKMKVSLPGVSSVTTTVEINTTALEPGGKYQVFNRTSSSLRLYRIEESTDELRLVHCRWGHGIGLSQNGARQRAKNGDTFRQILDFYFPHTELTKMDYREPVLDKIEDELPPEALKIDKAVYTLVMPNTEKLKVTPVPKEASGYVLSYSSAQEEVCTVSKTGVLTPKSKGRAIITVKDKGTGVTAKAYVTVLDKKPITGDVTVSVSPKTLMLAPKEARTLKGVIKPEGANPYFFYTSTDPSIAKVTVRGGSVTGVSEGSCKIKVLSAHTGKYISVPVTVGRVPVTGVNVSPSTTRKVELGKSFSLKATVQPENATDKKVVWTSSNKNVASVDENGRVKTKKTGTTYIKATAQGKSDRVKVMVMSSADSIYLKIDANVLNIRRLASTSSKILGTTTRGEKFLLTRPYYKQGWHQITYKGNTAYISADYADIPTDTALMAKSKTSAKLYERTRTTSKVLKSIKKGARVYVIAAYPKEKWHKASFSGKTGYILAKDFDISAHKTVTKRLKKAAAAYKTASTASTKLLSLKAGASVRVLDAQYKSGWYQVIVKDKIAYMRASGF